MRIRLLLFVCALAILAVPALAQPGAEDRDGDMRVESGKREVARLTQEEKKVQAKIAEVKKRVADLEKGIAAQEKILDGLRAREANATKDQERLEAARSRAQDELRDLLVSIWPIRRMDVEAKLRGLKTWSEADRRFTWLASIYEATDRKLALVAEQTLELARNLARQEALKAEAAAQLKAVNDSKDKLLGDKLALLADLKKVQAKRKSAEEELNEILSTISELKYEEIKTPSTMRFTSLKGLLPWPALGSMVERFNPRARPPCQGIGLALKADSMVRSIFWGKVVHNDTLRGFGRVVILYHGQNYYSLYAFLADSNVRLGQQVEKDEPIGTAGYYPKADGPGLYFELRFRQKAINPLPWLGQLR